MKTPRNATKSPRSRPGNETARFLTGASHQRLYAVLPLTSSTYLVITKSTITELTQNNNPNSKIQTSNPSFHSVRFLTKPPPRAIATRATMYSTHSRYRSLHLLFASCIFATIASAAALPQAAPTQYWDDFPTAVRTVYYYAAPTAVPTAYPYGELID